MTYGGLTAVLMVSCCVILLAASTQPIHRADRTTPVSLFSRTVAVVESSNYAVCVVYWRITD